MLIVLIAGFNNDVLAGGGGRESARKYNSYNSAPTFSGDYSKKGSKTLEHFLWYDSHEQVNGYSRKLGRDIFEKDVLKDYNVKSGQKYWLGYAILARAKDYNAWGYAKVRVVTRRNGRTRGKYLKSVGEQNNTKSSMIYKANKDYDWIRFSVVTDADKDGLFNKKDWAVTSKATLNAYVLNSAPTVKNINRQSVNERDRLRVRLYQLASDPDGDNLSYSKRSGPGYVSGSNYYYKPSYNTVKNGRSYVNKTAKIRVNDGNGHTKTITIPIRVHNKNRKPSISAKSNVTIDEGESINVKINTSDPDGDSLSLVGRNSFTRSLLSGNRLKWSTDYRDEGTYHAKLYVKDEYGSKAYKTVKITVKNKKQNKHMYKPKPPTYEDYEGIKYPGKRPEEPSTPIIGQPPELPVFNSLPPKPTNPGPEPGFGTSSGVELKKKLVLVQPEELENGSTGAGNSERIANQVVENNDPVDSEAYEDMKEARKAWAKAKKFYDKVQNKNMKFDSFEEAKEFYEEISEMMEERQEVKDENLEKYNEYKKEIDHYNAKINREWGKYISEYNRFKNRYRKWERERSDYLSAVRTNDIRENKNLKKKQDYAEELNSWQKQVNRIDKHEYRVIIHNKHYKLKNPPKKPNDKSVQGELSGSLKPDSKPSLIDYEEPKNDDLF